jgi:hypothetical protein
MPCTYRSTAVFETFADLETLKEAIRRVDLSIAKNKYRVTGRSGNYRVEARNEEEMNELKQVYQVVAVRQTAKKKGFFVQEKRLPDGKIRLTVRA